MTRAILSLINEAYRLDVGDQQWLEAMAEQAARMVPGSSGTMVYEFDASDPTDGVDVPRRGAFSVPDSFVKSTIQLNRCTTAVDAARFYHRGILSGTVSEVLRNTGGSIETNTTYSDTMAKNGYADTFGLTASSPIRRGLVINAPLECEVTLEPRTKLAWRQAGVHLQAAYRLRESLQRNPRDPEAVVDAERGILHCEGEAKEPSMREQLHRAARAIDTARTRQATREPHHALQIWAGLVSGRWTLVESFERDGRRFFLAYPNEIAVQSPRALSSRERAVVSYVVQGDSNKWIAYQLGVSAATVARHLATSLCKLGLSHRHELIWLYHSLHGSDSSGESE